MITVEVDHSRADIKLGKITENVRTQLRAVIMQDGPDLANRVRQKLSGEVLHVRSGALLASIHNEMVESPTTIYGRVYSSGVPYARIHEYGGQTRAHMIYPVNAKALRFEIDGKVIFAKAVHHPGSKIPMRSYLRSSLDEMRAKILSDLAAGARRGAAAA